MSTPYESSWPAVTDLPFAERFTLWVMRQWAIGYRQQQPVEKQITAAFDQIGLANGAYLLDTAMLTLIGGRQRPLELNCTCYRCLSQDEQALLNALAHQQRGQRQTAYTLLEPLLTQIGLGIVTQRLELLAHALRNAELQLTTRALAPKPTLSATIIPFPAL